jgi:hypothetical protein
MPNDGLSQLARALLVSAPGWGLQNPRGDQDVTPGGWDASFWPGDIDPGMERVMPSGPGVQRVLPMELDPQPNVDRWLGILLNQPQRI